jgi:hyaluronoglucosaminidase
MHTESNIPAGVIEGFFGKPWGWPARLGAVDFLREAGFDFYIYAPKGDPYLRRKWREPQPLDTLEHLAALGARCRDRGIDFGIGLTPFEIYLQYDAAARGCLRAKVLELNETGADTLAILFDDMRGDVPGIAELQARVLADISGWSSARRFMVCPTYYSYDTRLTREFGTPPKAYLEDLGRLLDPRIDCFWTGEQIISNGYSARHLFDVAADLNRKPFIWDNHIANDAKTRTNHLYLDPSAGSWSLAVEAAAGLAINPMNQPHLSRIALSGYRHLLGVGPDLRSALPGIYRELAGPRLAELLSEDLRFLQNEGLSRLDEATRRGLLERYESEAGNPYADEVAAFLRGEYAFDPECLTS